MESKTVIAAAGGALLAALVGIAVFGIEDEPDTPSGAVGEAVEETSEAASEGIEETADELEESVDDATN